MYGRRTIATLAALLVATLALAPSAAAETQQGTTSTGDVDTYNVWTATHGFPACTDDIVVWGVHLALQDPAPGDRVLVTAHDHGVPTPANAAVATYEDPQVQLRVDGGGCDPPVEVAGLTVSGDLGYTVSW